MENNNLPQDSVVISRAEYDSLRQTQTLTPPQPVPEYIAASSFSTYNLKQDKKLTTTQLILALLAVGVIATLIFPIGAIFFVPILIFTVLALKGFFKSDPTKSPEKQAGSLLFKIIAVICISVGALIGLFVIFIIVIFGLFASGAGGGQSS